MASVHTVRASRPSVISVMPAVGGCGVTTLLASLAQAFSIVGERVLAADSGSPSTLGSFFRAKSEVNGLLRSTQAISPFEGQVHVLRTDSEAAALSQSWSTRFHRAVAELRGGADRILLSGESVRAVLGQLAECMYIVVLTPELRSLLAVSADNIWKLSPLERSRNTTPWFILNRYDESNALHEDMRDRLRRELGPRLLPIAIPESSTVDLSLAAGLTPLDFAPQSSFAEACFDLVEWFRSDASQVNTPSSHCEEKQFVQD